MQKSITLTLAGVALASMVAFTLRDGSTSSTKAARSSFTASVRGDISADSRGQDAEFGLTPRGLGAPGVMTVSLGARQGKGAVVFTQVDGRGLEPGVYPISEDGNLRALVVTGTASQPSGVFRGQSGVLTVSQASDRSLTGKFQLAARGFLASDPADEGRQVSMSGSFTAIRATN